MSELETKQKTTKITRLLMTIKRYRKQQQILMFIYSIIVVIGTLHMTEIADVNIIGQTSRC